MQKVGKYVEKHPEIVLATCDDNACMTSTLVLIPHRDHEAPRSGYWRTTVIFIPQNGQEPAEFSLSGWRERSLVDGLKQVKKMH